MANAVYNGFKVNLFLGLIDFSSVTGMVMLVDAGYAISQGETVTGDITSEITSDGYDRGGRRIESTFITFLPNSSLAWTGMPVTWTGITANPRYGIVYISGGTHDTAYVVGQLDLGNQTVVASDFTITWNSGGIFNML